MVLCLFSNLSFILLSNLSFILFNTLSFISVLDVKKFLTRPSVKWFIKQLKSCLAIADLIF